jgi:hypothetical protein
MATLTIDSIEIETIPDDDPDVSWLEQEGFEDRRETYELGYWYLFGVRLLARITLEHAGRIPETIELRTPGLWGVESDAGEEYLDEIAADELPMLVEDLRAFGFSPTEIGEAIAHLDHAHLDR